MLLLFCQLRRQLDFLRFRPSAGFEDHGGVHYELSPRVVVGLVSPPPRESWDVVILPKATVALSAGDIFGCRGRGDEVRLFAWIADSAAGRGATKQDETIDFTP